MCCRYLRFVMPLVLVATALLYPIAAHAGIAGPAGVEIDADGVLRKKVYDDPGGVLTKRRIAAAEASLSADIARTSELRMISLNRLEAALAARLAAGDFETDDMKYLAGLTRIQYVFFYPETNDIVIGGPAEGYMEDISGRAVGIDSGRAVLELQDLVVALRAFPPTGDQTNLISVSIDPTREGLTRMAAFLGSLGRVTPRDAKRITAGLQESLGRQKVTIKGVAPETHFAQVMVEADYRMKLIGIGLESTPAGIRSYVSRANPRSRQSNAMQRWYFTPNYECVRVATDEMAMELVGNGVKLIGEDERVAADGTRVSAKRSDRASKAFVQEFTKKYSKLAEYSPVYAQLKNLIDMAIAAAFIQEQDYYGQAGWEMEVLLDESRFPVETYTVPKHVDTAANAVWKGNSLMTPVGGGVNLQPRQALLPENLLQDDNGELLKRRASVKLKDLAEGQWWWD